MDGNAKIIGIKRCQFCKFHLIDFFLWNVMEQNPKYFSSFRWWYLVQTPFVQAKASTHIHIIARIASILLRLEPGWAWKYPTHPTTRSTPPFHFHHFDDSRLCNIKSCIEMKSGCLILMCGTSFFIDSNANLPMG